MEIVVDTSVIMAVILDEPERGQIVAVTKGNSLVGPGSLPWEIGNAFTAMFKQGRIDLKNAIQGVEIFQTIPLRTVPVNMESALSLAWRNKMYAYDCYVIDCASRLGAPLLSLDRKLKNIARESGIQTLEI